MQITITGTIEEIKAFVERIRDDPANARVDEDTTPPSEGGVGAVLAKIAKAKTGNNKKVLNFLVEKGQQSQEAIAAELSIAPPKLNGNIGAINRMPPELKGQRIIQKKRRAHKMYYMINPLVLPSLSR
jgi:hypothetical protein